METYNASQDMDEIQHLEPTPEDSLEKEIKGVQLVPIGEEITNDQSPYRNSNVFWKKDLSTIVIGRSPQSGASRRLAPNSFALPCPVMSREHAVLHLEGNKVFLTDSGSHHGTWRPVYGFKSKVEEKHLVSNGDIFIFGKRVEKNGQTHNPATVAVKFIYSDRISVEPSDSDSNESVTFIQSNRYAFDDEDSEDISEDNEVEFSSEVIAAPYHAPYPAFVPQTMSPELALKPIQDILRSPSFSNTSEFDWESRRLPSLEDPSVGEVALPSITSSPVPPPSAHELDVDTEQAQHIEHLSFSPPSFAPSSPSPKPEREVARFSRDDSIKPTYIANGGIEELEAQLKGLKSSIESLKSYRRSTNTRLILQEHSSIRHANRVNKVLEASDQRITTIESRLADVTNEVEQHIQEHFNDTLRGDVAMESADVLEEVRSLWADVAGDNAELRNALNEVKAIVADAEIAIKAHAEILRRPIVENEANDTSVTLKAPSKRSIDEVYEADHDAEAANRTNGAGGIEIDPVPIAIDDPVATINHVPTAGTTVGNDGPSPSKRARIEIVIPSAAGVLAGAVAGSLLTWAGLAYA